MDISLYETLEQIGIPQKLDRLWKNWGPDQWYHWLISFSVKSHSHSLAFLGTGTVWSWCLTLSSEEMSPGTTTGKLHPKRAENIPCKWLDPQLLQMRAPGCVEFVLSPAGGLEVSFESWSSWLATKWESEEGNERINTLQVHLLSDMFILAAWEWSKGKKITNKMWYE